MSEKKSIKAVFMNGILKENPTFRLLLGMCPTLAISTAVTQGIGMGLATTFVLVFSNLVISLLRNIIPEKVRIPAFVVVIATFVTIVDLIMKAFLPSLSASLGLYIPLIVVNCIIFARAESFASKNPPLSALTDGLGMGLGFTLSLTLLSAAREVFGSGTFLGVQVMPASYHPMAIIIRPPGGFIMLGLLLLAVNAVVKAIQKHKAAKAKEEIA
ncbi:MAG: electron transport complex subunit E [Eubacteriales bacterium]|nr:electron transport complex subunit E [Eubacteriales bacterium]